MNSEEKKSPNHDFEVIKVRGNAPESELIRDSNGEIIYEEVKELSEILPPMEPPLVDSKIDMEVFKLPKERQSRPVKVFVPAIKKIPDGGIIFDQKITKEEKKLYDKYKKEVDKPGWEYPDSESIFEPPVIWLNLPSGKKVNLREPIEIIEETTEKMVDRKMKRNL